MTGREHVERVLANLKDLGARRQLALASLVVVGVGASYFA